MRLVANKPCSFGGRQFFIGDVIPDDLIVDTKAQEKLGVITIVNDSNVVPDGKSGTFFTQEQVDAVIGEALEKAEKEHAVQMEKMREEYAFRLEKMKVHAAELEETEPGAYGDMVQIPVKGASDKEFTEISVKLEEIQQAFAIMQMNAEEGAKAISDVTSENVLILLHAADNRKTVKNAAKEQADKLFSTEDNSNESSKDNETTGTGTEGADA